MIRDGSPSHPSRHGGSQPHIAERHDSTNTDELLQASLSVRIYLLLLATSLPKANCNSERSASVTIPNLPVASANLCSCRGVAECGDPLVSSTIGINVEKELQFGRNLAPAFCKAHVAKRQVLVHCLVIQVFCSQVSRVVLSTTRVILMSPLIT